MNQPTLRLSYLEKASSIRPESRSIKRALAAAYLNSKKYAQTAQLLNELKPFDKDVRLKKIEYYLTITQKNYSLAFQQAEALFNWPDPAERITTVSPGFASTSTQVYAQQGKLQLMLKRLQQARKYSPQSHNLKNSSAYFMAQHKLQLDLAEKLSRESLSYMPDNSSYLDTLAWIKYQKNELDEAWKLINKAIELDEKKSAEILMHAGDICLAMDGLFSESQAKVFWQKALLHAKNKDLIKRIKDKLKRQ
jgi:tetratricopeptide (TPR) repeat protein